MRVVVLSLLLAHFSQGQLIGSGLEVPGSGLGSGIGLPCPAGQFYCQNSSDVCVREELVCDGQVDCPSGEDEAVCSLLNCNLDEYRCVSGDSCISLNQMCDGVVDCVDFDDESSCAAGPGSTVALNEFECSPNGQRIARAFLCNGEQNCPNGEDEARCDRPQAQMLVPGEVSVMPGGNISLSCGAMGYPPAFITWQRNLLPLPRNSRYSMTSSNGYSLLHISDASLEDGGMYYCLVVSSLYGSALVKDSVLVRVQDPSPSTCIAQNHVVYPEGAHYYDVRPVGLGSASQSAADIIFVVDESGSMASGEQDWIREEVQVLDRMLKEKGVGSGSRRNMFALVGYSRNNPQDILGITLTTLTSSSNFVAASRQLMVTGTAEDGYAAIDHALSSITTRPNTAKQIILVTDSDRQILRFDLNRDVMEQRLRDRGFSLNVVVNQGFVISETDRVFALGITNTTGYVLDPLARRLYSTVNSNEVTLSRQITFGSTIEDYVNLALSLNGAAWDINQLREGGTFARAFVNVFSDVQVQEMMEVFRYCFMCQCRSGQEVCSVVNDVPLSDCSGSLTVLRSAITPESTLVQSEDPLSLSCLVYSNSEETVDIEWLYPPGLQVTVNGDTLMVSRLTMAANFTCIATQSATGASASATGASASATASVTLDSRCRLPGGSYLVLGSTRVVLVPRDANQSRVADVIVLVDESGSMADELSWLSDMTRLLDRSLEAAGIGATQRNNFGVVGFGGGCSLGDDGLGRVLVNDMQQMFTSGANVSELLQRLELGGMDEDGYSAISIALREFAFRDGAKQFILVTDEDRSVRLRNLTRQDIKSMLENAGVQLNVAISEEFVAGDLRALGLDSSSNAYLFDPSVRSAFVVEPGMGVDVMDSAHGSTHVDYTTLAWELGGAAWDLSQLRQGGDIAKAFTNAFIRAKVVEIQSQLDKCWNCFCSQDGPLCEPVANFSLCMTTPAVPPGNEEPVDVLIEGEERVTLRPSRTHSFTCVVNTTAVIRWTMDGRNLPANARVQDVGGFVSRLIIRSPNEANTGVYVCSAHTQSGFYGNRDTITLTFYDPSRDLMLMVSPSQALVTKKDAITLTCSAASPSFFTWTFNGDRLLPVNSITSSTAKSSVLQLQNVEKDFEGVYFCSAVRRDLAVSAEVAAHIQVMDPVLSVQIEPDRVVVSEGDPLNVKCRVNCFCPGVRLTWTRENDDSLSSMAMVSSDDSGSYLNITSTQDRDSGRYICSAELDNVTTSSEFYLTVNSTDKFSVIVVGDSEVEVINGSYYSILCQTNLQARSFMWTFNGIPIQGERSLGSSLDNVVAISVSNFQSIVSISDITDSNEGTYGCVATSADGIDSVISIVELLVV